ncbi:MAG: mercuric reductase [Candidatus Zixiibacteriota bacterium]
MPVQRYDAIVIGAGQGGGPLSTALAGAGRRTALIERRHVGGTCVNEGCTPTKTMIASGRVAHLVQRAHEYGIHPKDVVVDMERIRQRKRDIVTMFRSGSRKRIESTSGVDLIYGDAHFTGERTLEVARNDGETVVCEADWIFVNTGTRPARPSIEGLDQVPAFDSTSIMELDQVPQHLIILGGGYIGVEFGQLFRRLRSKVTIIHRGTQLLPREDDDIADEVGKIFREDGIEVLLETTAKRIRRMGNDIEVELAGQGGESSVNGTHLLIATGRRPNTDTLDCNATGMELDERGYIRVNSRLETSVPGIWALGDVNGGPAFTHIAYDDYRILKSNLLENGARSTESRLVPYTVFMDPQLGRVGPTEKALRALGQKYTVAKLPMTSVARALETDETRGFMKALVDPASKEILGAAILGLEGGELAGGIQLAMMGHLPYTAIRDAVFSHPTLTESLNSLFGSVET